MADFSVQIISAIVEAVSAWINSMFFPGSRSLVIRFNFNSISTFYSTLFDWEKLFKEIKDLFQNIVCFWHLPCSTTVDRSAEDNSKVLWHIVHLARFADFSFFLSQSLKSGSSNQSSTKYFWFLILFLLLIITF